MHVSVRNTSITMPKEKFNAETFLFEAIRGKKWQAVQDTFGNDGLIIWYVLLQDLTTTEHHYFKAPPVIIEQIAKAARTTPDTVIRFLDFMTDNFPEHFDFELWSEFRIIRNSKLIRNLDALYSKRAKTSQPKTIEEITKNELKLRELKEAKRTQNKLSELNQSELNRSEVNLTELSKLNLSETPSRDLQSLHGACSNLKELKDTDAVFGTKNEDFKNSTDGISQSVQSHNSKSDSQSEDLTTLQSKEEKNGVQSDEFHWPSVVLQGESGTSPEYSAADDLLGRVAVMVNDLLDRRVISVSQNTFSTAQLLNGISSDSTDQEIRLHIINQYKNGGKVLDEYGNVLD